MGHTIQYYDYPENTDKKKVEQELANYVAKRCFQEGGHLSKIRWIDSEPCANDDEAHEKIERLDKGWYDCIAVKYYDAYNVPETEKIKALRAANTQAYCKYKELASAFHFANDFGTRIPFAVGSRADALAQLQNRYFFRATPQTRVEVGSTTTASVLSCGPRYVIVEAFGVEVSMGTGALSAFEYIEDASKSFKVGMGIPVAVEALEVDARAKTVNIRVSHSLLERMSAKVEGVSESMIGGRYLATIVNVTDKYYHVVLDGLKIRGVIPKTQNISNEMLMIGDKVSMLVRYINKEQALVIGGCHKI